MKNVRVFLSTAFVFGCLGVFGLVSCADSVIAPPQAVATIKRNAEATSVVKPLSNANAITLGGNTTQSVDAGITIIQTTLNSDNSITVRFRLLIQSPTDPTPVDVTRTVENLGTGQVFGSAYVGTYGESGVYSTTSPSGLPSGSYRLTLNTSGGGSSARIVTIP